MRNARRGDSGRARVYHAASMLIWVAFGIPPPGGRGRNSQTGGNRAGAPAGVLAHHRGMRWTTTRAQTRGAPGTLSQCASHLRLPLGGSLPSNTAL